ncbi:hypothetical protein OB236_34230 [Paenibacillus sp. WQ 127069]|uniref:Glycosyl hydrolase family 36 C-terminal domain-containing protein n=1 Tax=Paenibacillus baimaensis TaxID=2982185 RepID=A0ABT2URB5_9BACL|nr:hypothetical protein [Paenibacillus sp. WQ 127069]
MQGLVVLARFRPYGTRLTVGVREDGVSVEGLTRFRPYGTRFTGGVRRMERLWWNGSRIVPTGLAGFEGTANYLLRI